MLDGAKGKNSSKNRRRRLSKISAAGREGLRVDDKELIRKSAAGDGDAFETLVRDAFSAVYAHARRMLRDEHEAENATQEAFLKAYRSLGTFDGRSKFKTWVISIVSNHCLNLIGRKKMGSEKAREAAFRQGDRTERPDRSVENAELSDALKTALSKIRRSEAQAFLLVTASDLSYEEGAELLGVSKGTFAWMVYEAKKKLRGILQPEIGVRRKGQA